MSEGIDYDQMAAVYDKGRAFPVEWLKGWRDALAPYLQHLPAPVVDLGSGTGIWSPLLAEWFGAEVIAVEPSPGMRAEAVRKRSHPRVRYMGGEAEHLPLKDAACAAAWISTVVHHIGDVEAAAREVRGVLRPGGRVLIRNAFSGRHGGVPWTRFFPSALRLAEIRHPSIDATVKAFSVAGFDKEALHSVSQMSASSLMEYAERIASRTDSTLSLIGDEDFDRGLAELRMAAQREDPKPVTTVLDLLVLR